MNCKNDDVVIAVNRTILYESVRYDRRMSAEHIQSPGLHILLGQLSLIKTRGLNGGQNGVP